MLNYGLLYESSMKINKLIQKTFKNKENELSICVALNSLKEKPTIVFSDNLSILNRLTSKIEKCIDENNRIYI